MRLRAIRVEADVLLSTGVFTVDQATTYFQTQVPLSREEARGEVLARLAAPAQGLSYVVGKIQLYAYLEALQQQEQQGMKGREQGTDFDLAAFHASILSNGNLPVVLQKHAAGIHTALTPAFENLFTAMDGCAVPRVPPALDATSAVSSGINGVGNGGDGGDLLLHDSHLRSRLTDIISHPNRIQWLPGLPPPRPARSPASSSSPQFSGYQRVGGGGRSLFYLLVHAGSEGGARSESDMNALPIVIWLQGGNGCSSLIGALTENGPFLVRGSPRDFASPNIAASLQHNPYSLHRLAHVIYLDRPAGAGFSFSTSPTNASWANDNQTAADSVEALAGILAEYPWLCNRKVYVAGESYAGHFTVQLATVLAEAESDLCVDLGGVMVGNGVVDINQTNYAWFEAGCVLLLVVCYSY